VSKNHAATAVKAMAEPNIHLEVPVYTTTVQQVLHKFNILKSAATAKLMITENNVKRQNRCCDDHKTWTSGDRKYLCGQMYHPSHSSHHQIRFMFGKCPTKHIMLQCLFPTVKHGGESVMIRAAISWYSTGLINYSRWLNYCQ
jgi:hypothetical protein